MLDFQGRELLTWRKTEHVEASTDIETTDCEGHGSGVE